MVRLPLEGIQVIDLGFIWAGPLYGRIIADMGATVIKIEAIQYIDESRGSIPPPRPDSIWPGYKDCVIREPIWEAGGAYQELNRNKYNITLDLSRPKGREIFKRLVSVSDVVAHNYAPGQMEKFGLGYPSIKEIKPDIIMVALSGWGYTGPEAKYKAFGIVVEAMSGLTSITGYPEPEPPMKCGIDWGDMPGPVLAVGFTLAALDYRNRTGKGQFIDLSQREACTGLLGEAIVGYSMNKTSPPRIGNHHPSFAPYNLYPAKAGPLKTPTQPPRTEPELDEHWIAISARTDEEWKALCRAMDNPDWAKDERFSDAFSRWQNQEELDKHIAEWTSQQEMYELMFLLQREGVPAGGAFDSRDLALDLHLRTRNFWVEVERPVTGKEVWDDAFCKLSKTPSHIRMPAPLLGQHNEYIYKQVLGIPDEEYEELVNDKIIGTLPLASNP